MYVEVPVKEDSIIGLNITLPSCYVCEYCCLPHGLKGFLSPHVHQVGISPSRCFLKFMLDPIISY